MYASVYESVHACLSCMGSMEEGWCACILVSLHVLILCVHVALSDLPPGLCGPNQMVGNINFTIPFSSSPFLSSYLLV